MVYYEVLAKTPNCTSAKSARNLQEKVCVAGIAASCRPGVVYY